jgi:hypothetical protein
MHARTRTATRTPTLAPSGQTPNMHARTRNPDPHQRILRVAQLLHGGDAKAAQRLHQGLRVV